MVERRRDTTHLSCLATPHDLLDAKATADHRNAGAIGNVLGATARSCGGGKEVNGWRAAITDTKQERVSDVLHSIELK